jgi:PBP1b-binding outer membrane lipoprotein LpoB
MKKIIVIALAVTSILLLAGCVGLGTPGYNDVTGNGPAVRENGTVQNPDLPPPFPEEDGGTSPADPDMPPPLPE